MRHVRLNDVLCRLRTCDEMRTLRKAGNARVLGLQEMLADVWSGRIMNVTREMINAGHDVMLKRGMVLSYKILTEIYCAMDQAAPPPQTPFDTCPTCEALARTVMMDQTGAA